MIRHISIMTIFTTSSHPIYDYAAQPTKALHQPSYIRRQSRQHQRTAIDENRPISHDKRHISKTKSKNPTEKHTHRTRTHTHTHPPQRYTGACSSAAICRRRRGIVNWRLTRRQPLVKGHVGTSASCTRPIRSPTTVESKRSLRRLPRIPNLGCRVINVWVFFGKCAKFGDNFARCERVLRLLRVRCGLFGFM